MIKKIGMTLAVVFMAAIILGIAYAGYLIVTDGGSTSKAEPEQSVEAVSETVGEPTEQVNEPLPDGIVTMGKNSGYKDAHDFISQAHQFYNDTICWGRLNSASYDDQRQTAEKIVTTIDGMKSKNDAIANDLKNAQKTAKVVVGRDDRDAMVQLHRYFHDLDIYFNGYDYSQTWGITEYTGQ